MRCLLHVKFGEQQHDLTWGAVLYKILGSNHLPQREGASAYGILAFEKDNSSLGGIATSTAQSPFEREAKGPLCPDRSTPLAPFPGAAC